MAGRNLISRVVSRARFEYRASRWKRLAKLGDTHTVETPQGIFTFRTQDSVIGKSLYCFREFESELIERTADFLHKTVGVPRSGTVLDVGANIGVTSVALLLDGVVERAIAVEPEPRNFKLLETNVRQNGLEERVMCLPFAAAAESGLVELEISETNFGDHRIRSQTPVDGVPELWHENNRATIQIRAERLDAMVAEIPQHFSDDIGFLWIDAQGYEGFAFLGAAALLRRGLPTVAEIWPYGLTRTGMDLETFKGICSDAWSRYWVLRNGEFKGHPISELETLLQDLGPDGPFTNIVLTP